MKLSITATLTDEELAIIANAKWYQSKVFLAKEWVVSDTHSMDDYYEKDNPQSAQDFVVSVYQAMIINDATKLFTEYRTQELKEQIAQTEQIVKQGVESVITSSIE